MEACIELYLLGPIQIKHHGKILSGFESRKALALLCYLAAQKRSTSRAQLVHLFWGNKEEARGRANLSRVLHNNAALLPDCFDIARDMIEFKAATSIFVDIHYFLELTKRPDLPSLLEATTYYRGHFMADIAVKDCPEFDAWLTIEQELWSQRMAALLHTLVTQYRNTGDYEQGLYFAERLLAQDPWREEAHREMMLMLALSGKRTAALAQYEKCCDILVDELGVNPSAETTALYSRIRNGEIRQRNNQPIINYIPQAIQDTRPTFPSLPSASMLMENNSNAVPFLPFVANDEIDAPNLKRKVNDFGQVLERLTNPGCRMLTIVGPNNAIQKRLLTEVMNSLTKVFYDGVYFVTNGHRAHRSLLVDIAYSLNLPEGHLLWDEGEQANIWFFKQLREKKLLLVISDAEQYLGTLVLLEEILKRAPLVKLLISARSPLQLNSEWIFDIY